MTTPTPAGSMWHALRAELAYFRLWLLASLGIAAVTVIILSVVFMVADDAPPLHAIAAMRALFLLLAPMIVCFVIQAHRAEERRARLLLAGPLTPWQLAGVSVLLPAVLLGAGAVAAALVMAAERLVTGQFEPESLSMVVFVGAQMFTYTQLGLLAGETAAAHRQQRPRAAAAAWAGIAAGVLLLAVLYVELARGQLNWSHAILGHLLLAIIATAAGAGLYAGRNDFTR